MRKQREVKITLSLQRRRFWCFSRPATLQNDEYVVKQLSHTTSGVSDGEQGHAVLDERRDSKERLAAYLGEGTHFQSGASVLAQAARTAARVRTLKGLAEDEGASSTTIASSHSFAASSSILSSSPPSRSDRETADDATSSSVEATVAGEEEEDEKESGSSISSAAQLPPATTPLSPHLQLCDMSPPQQTPLAKENPALETTPPASESPLDVVMQSSDDSPLTAENPTKPPETTAKMALCEEITPDNAKMSPSDATVLPHHPGQAGRWRAGVSAPLPETVRSPFSSIIPVYDAQSKTISNATSAIESVGMDASAAAATSSSSSAAAAKSPLTTYLSLPHRSYSMHAFPLETSFSEGPTSSLTRRHTALILLSNSDDDSDNDGDDDDAVIGVNLLTNGEASSSSSSSLAANLSLTRGASSSSLRSQQSRVLQRKLSGVCEGHHVRMNKLQDQIGNPDG